MRDYWLTQYILAAVGWGYAIVCTVAVALALWLPKGKKAKALSAAVVIGFASILPFRGYEQYRKEQEAAEAYQARLARAQTMFAERCKTAGEKIHKRVEGVEGIYLMKLRTTTNFGGQFELDDPYGHDVEGSGYISSFLQSYHRHFASSPPRTGYAYVEAEDPKDGQRYRYTGRIEQPSLTDSSYSADYKRFVMDSALATGKQPRYGVTYDDISTREEREHWIAGSSLKVIDLQTNEVIAERIGYMVDWAQGNRSGGRSPWLYAANNACPNFYRNHSSVSSEDRRHSSSGQVYQTIDFVEKVLKPTK